MTYSGPIDSKEPFFNAAFEKFHESMVFYAFQFSGNEKDAEDIVQEVYVKVFEKDYLVFDDEKALKTYLFRSVRNTSLDKLDKKDAMRHAIDIINQEVQEESFIVFDENILTEIRLRIDMLSPQTRKIITAVFLDGKKYREVAEELGISINTVKTMLQKGITTLRKHFKGPKDTFLLHLIFLL